MHANEGRDLCAVGDVWLQAEAAGIMEVKCWHVAAALRPRYRIPGWADPGSYMRIIRRGLHCC